MADRKPAAGDGVGERGTTSNACGQPGFCSLLLPKPPDKDNKHVVRILGTYSLLTFFEEEGQRAFFEKITSEEFENSLKHTAKYARCIEPFHLDTGEKEFELRMTNMGFIREGFWREAFSPIFELKPQNIVPYGPWPSWISMLPKPREEGLFELLPSSSAGFEKNQAPAYLYAYSLCKLGAELEKVKRDLDLYAELRFHIGLNKFGIVNIGLTIKWKHDEAKTIRFEDLCKSAYKAVSHLQEDPLEDLKCEADALTAGDQKTLLEKVSDALETGDCPRLVVSYFQALALTTIHRFLHDKLVAKAIPGFQIEWLANPWELSNKIEESTRYKLPPLRHVVFMYQLVHPISEKEDSPKKEFLEKERRALLTLGHNVGWSPSDNSPFPAFDSRRAKLNDSSLLETSCCLVFPQGLVVVIPPERSGETQECCPGGTGDNKSSLKVPYRDYWKLIFKLFIRVAEARLLIGMVNRELSDIHKAFLKNRQTRLGGRAVKVGIGKLRSWFFACMTREWRCCLLVSYVIGKVGSWLSECMKSESWWCRWVSFVIGKVRSLIDGIDSISSTHSRLMRVGSIIQRTSGRVITPEVTRYSFVRRKLTDFLKTVNFEEHRGHIQSEFEKLNEWVESVRTVWVARAAIVVALLVAVGTPWFQKWLNSLDNPSPSCAEQSLPELSKGLSGEMDNLKKSTAAVNSEMDKLKEKIGPLAKDLEALKRCQHHKQKAHKQ